MATGLARSALVGINFHVHTRGSPDGYNTPALLCRTARRNGLGALAITDHDSIDGARAFADWLARKGVADFRAIICEEVTCDDGTHVIGLCLERAVRARRPSEVADEVHAQGGFVYLPHPTRPDGVFASAGRDELLERADFYEVYNGKLRHEHNQRALAMLPERLLPLGGSDAHYAGDVGMCACYLEDHGTPRASLEAYRRSRRIAIFGRKWMGDDDPALSLYYRVKALLPIPRALREAGKLVYPLYRNFRGRSVVWQRERIYGDLEGE